MLTALLIGVLNLPPLLYAVAGLLAVWLWTTRRGLENIPPVADRPYPLVGHLPYLRKEPLQVFQKWRQSKGDIFSVYLGRRLVVVLNNYSLIHEALVKKSDAFSDRPHSFVTERIVKEGELGVINNSGASWKEQRTVSMAILRNFGMGKNWLAEKISEEVEIYLDKLSSFNGEPRDIRMFTNTTVSNIICTIILGRRFHLDDPKFVKLLHNVNSVVSLLGATNPLSFYPWLEHLPGDPFKAKLLRKNFKENNEYWRGKCVSEVNDHKAGQGNENFITAYCGEMDTKQQKGTETHLCESSLLRVINNLFNAGSETTSTTIMWVLVFAIRHPDAQERVYREIVDVAGTHKLPSITDKSKMPFTNSFIMEAQRLGSIVPLSIPHMCNQTVELAGFTIPKDTTILPNIDAVLSDVNTWTDPDNFRPERFLDENNKVFVPEEFIPFSIGRRYCMGESLAKMELFLFVTAIFQRFNVIAEDPENPPSTNRVFGITSAPTSFKVRLEDRRKE